MKMKLLLNLFIVSAVSIGLVGIIFADTIYLNNGNIIKGLVVEEHKDRVVFSTREGEKIILNKDIDEIFFDDLEQNYYYIANRFLEEKDFERAERFYKKSLELNPGYKRPKDAMLYLNDVRIKNAKKWDGKEPLLTLKKELGISIARSGDFCVVKETVIKNSKLKEGDSIISFWDRSAKFIDEKEAVDKLIGEPNTPVRLTVERKATFKPLRVPWYFKLLNLKKLYTLPLAMEYDGLTIGTISNIIAGSKSQFETGDRIIAIDGKPTRYMPLSEANTLINKKKRGEAELTIDRDIELIRY